MLCIQISDQFRFVKLIEFNLCIVLIMIETYLIQSKQVFNKMKQMERICETKNSFEISEF